MRKSSLDSVDVVKPVYACNCEVVVRNLTHWNESITHQILCLVHSLPNYVVECKVRAASFSLNALSALHVCLFLVVSS